MTLVPLFLLLVLKFMSCKAINGSQPEASIIQLELPRSATDVRFDDLPEDVLFIIIEFLNFDDLLSLTEMSISLAPLAVEIQRKRHHDVVIWRSNPSNKRYGRKFAENRFTKTLELSNFETTLTTLFRFGHAIKRLEIKNENIDEHKSAIIHRAVNDHARDTLTYFKMNAIKEDTFKQFTAPFERIEEVYFEVFTNQVKSGPLPLNDVFPNLRRLNLKLYTKTDYAFLNCTFNHLEQLFVSVADDAWKKKDQIEKLLVNNPHIRSIALQFFPANYIKRVATILPDLEQLVLYEIDIGNESVHFDNVRDFTLHSSLPRSIENLTFCHLESLSISYSSAIFNSWLRFLRNHPNIRKLEMHEFFDERTIQLLELTADLINLEDVTLASSNFIDANTITEFIERNKKLNKFVFTTIKANTRTRFETDSRRNGASKIVVIFGVDFRLKGENKFSENDLRLKTDSRLQPRKWDR